MNFFLTLCLAPLVLLFATLLFGGAATEESVLEALMPQDGEAKNWANWIYFFALVSSGYALSQFVKPDEESSEQTSTTPEAESAGNEQTT